MKLYCVYILASRTRVIYTGITGDLETRLEWHRSFANPKCFNAQYKCTRLVHFEEYSEVTLAIAGGAQRPSGSRRASPCCMTTTSPRIQYRQGDHVCTLYSTRDEQLSAAVEYLRGGLERGERCLYVVSEHTPDEFREGLRNAGIDVAAEEARGALLIVTKQDAHLKGGSFDPDKMITLLHAAVKDALDCGFAGLCAAGDMSWLLDEAAGSERIAEYEARLNQFYPSSRALGLCLYNRNKLPHETLDHSLATHPHVRIEGNLLLDNPFYESPEQAASRRGDRNAFAKKFQWLTTTLATLLPRHESPMTSHQ